MLEEYTINIGNTQRMHKKQIKMLPTRELRRDDRARTKQDFSVSTFTAF